MTFSLAPSRAYFLPISASTISGVITYSQSWRKSKARRPFSLPRKISIQACRNQRRFSPRSSSSLKGFIFFPRSAPNASLKSSLRCCLRSKSTVSSKLLVFKLRCSEDSFLAVSFETLTVVESMLRCIGIGVLVYRNATRGKYQRNDHSD